MRRVHADDTVVTPSARRAIVIRVDEEGFADVRYLDGGEMGTVHEKLLHVVKAGRQLPPPVRVAR